MLVVCCYLVTKPCPTLCDSMDCSMPGFSVLHYVLEFAQTHAHCVYHLILCCNLLLLPSIFPSIKVFSNELALYIRWPKYWSFSFRKSSSHEYSELISFKIDCFDLFALQWTLKSLFQHPNLKAPILWCLAFFMAQLLHLYTTTGKTITLTMWTFVSKFISAFEYAI